MQFFYTAAFLSDVTNVEASTYYSPASIVFLTKLPSTQIEWTAIAYSFMLETWLMIAVATVCVAILVYVQMKISSDPKAQKNALRTAFNVTYNNMVDQEIPAVPTEIRWISILWGFTCLILIQYYSSNLLSLLTYPAEEVIPNNMEELAFREDYDVVGIDLPGGSMEQYFNQSTSWDLVEIWKRARFLRIDKCVVEAVTESKQVCIGWDFIIEGFLHINTTIHELFYPAVKSHDPPITVLTSGILQKNSPFTDGINEAVGWLRDTGHYHKWLQEANRFVKIVGKAWVYSQKSSMTFERLLGIYEESLKAHVGPLKPENLLMPLLILVFSWAASTMIFMAEHYVRYRSK